MHCKGDLWYRKSLGSYRGHTTVRKDGPPWGKGERAFAYPENKGLVLLFDITINNTSGGTCEAIKKYSHVRTRVDRFDHRDTGRG